MTRLVLGTRGSDLALAQAELTRVALRASGFAGEIETRIVKTSGDRRTDIRLSDFAKENVVTQGAFTKELEDALNSGEIDAAVHSAKDLPSRLADCFRVGAALERAPVEDMLITRAGIPARFEELPRGATLATGSVRRGRIAGWLRPDLRQVDIRGNVPTRLRKLAAGDAGDATMLARAGLERLGMLPESAATLSVDGVELCCSPLPVSQFIPAGGQGAVCIEVLAQSPAEKAVRAIEHGSTARRLAAERAFLFQLGAGCDTPVGVHAGEPDRDGRMEMAAIVFDEQAPEAEPSRGSASGSALDPGELACRLLDEMKIERRNDG